MLSSTSLLSMFIAFLMSEHVKSRTVNLSIKGFISSNVFSFEYAFLSPRFDCRVAIVCAMAKDDVNSLSFFFEGKRNLVLLQYLLLSYSNV